MEVYISDMSFSYDIHSLVKAFYQEDDILVKDINEYGLHKINDNLISDTIFNIVLFDEVLSERLCDERKENKNIIKRFLYKKLCEKTGKVLPWGTLTGIRPTKIPMGMLFNGSSFEEIQAHMKDTYYVSDEKINVSYNIAKKEKQLIDGLHKNDGFSLYVGIPFCPTTCMYCSFTSYPIARFKNKSDAYIDTLKREIDFYSEVYENKFLDSVYIGGGTPTTLEPYQFDELIGYLREKFDFSTAKEFTVEAGRPDSITREKLKALKRNGVSRISVNPQTLNDSTLKLIGRNHNTAQFFEAFNLAREEGFDNINTDLILGLPGETEKEVEITFSGIEKLNPENVTVHSMAIKRAAHMEEYLKNHPEIKTKNSDEMMERAYKCAANLSMEPYYLYRQKNMTGNLENTGFAKKGYEGIYNILIMEEIEDIAALGAGSVSKKLYEGNRIERTDNYKDVLLYIDKFDELLEKKRKFYYG